MSYHRNSSSLILLVIVVFYSVFPSIFFLVENEVDDERNMNLERYVNPMTDGGRLEGHMFRTWQEKNIYRLCLTSFKYKRSCVVERW